MNILENTKTCIKNTNKLYHHGILGQKWGVRRYQNPDGSLTEEGRKRLKEIYSKAPSTPVSSYHYTNKISKGETITRYTSSKKETMDKRKYASVDPDDALKYKSYAEYGMLWAKDNKEIYEMKMSAIKDLKVAPYSKVINDIIEKNSDVKIKDIAKDLIDIDHFSKHDYTSDATSDNIVKKVKMNRKDRKLVDYVYNGEYELMKIVKQFNKNDDNINYLINKYSKEGYDAMVDAEDVNAAKYPIILLKPNKSVKVKKITKIK